MTGLKDCSVFCDHAALCVFGSFTAGLTLPSADFGKERHFLPLCSADFSSLSMECPVLGSSLQDGHGAPGATPAGGYEDDEGTGAYSTRRG